MSDDGGLAAKAKKALSKLASTFPASKQTRRETEIDLLRGMKDYDPEDRQTGVLLADKIQHYAEQFGLISPFQEKKLRPAGYELSVGEFYSKSGEVIQLTDEPGKNRIVIEPFEVVVIQIFERLNMPEFLIARWNVAVGKAYEGLLWVGAAQVDPGFRGYLCCPIYNLSNNNVELRLGESLAVIDFVGTTTPNAESRKRRFKYDERKRILIDEYDGIDSALRKLSEVRLDKVEKDVSELRTTVFNSTAIIFTALGALVTALALFVSNAMPQSASRLSAPLLISMAALVIALLGLVVAFAKSWVKRTTIFAFVLLALAVFLYWYANRFPNSNPGGKGDPAPAIQGPQVTGGKK